MIEQDSELKSPKDSSESGPEKWSDESLGNLDTLKSSLGLDQNTPEEVLDPNNPTSSSTMPTLTESDSEISTQVKGFNVYTNEQRYDACVAYVIYGKADKVSELTGVPLRTVYNWIKSDWWPRMLDQAKRDHQDLIEARLSDIVEKATGELIDRIVNGEKRYSVSKKTGKPLEYRVKISAKELNAIIAQLGDRLRTMRNQPSRISEDRKLDMDKIARTFAEIAEKNRERIVSSQ